MLIKKETDIKSSEITPKSLYLDRRKFMELTGITVGAAVIGSVPLACDGNAGEQGGAGTRLDDIQKSTQYSTSEEQTPYKDATSYNNFYEFGTGKDDPIENADTLKPRPWSVTVEGEAAQTGTFDYEDVIKGIPLEERIYRHRCVEAWSMVIPWVGVPLAEVLKKFEPNSNANYVAFETLYDPEQMPGQKRDFLDWPYREGLRMDEAMHPLTLFVVGMYGEVLPNQNGAPLRLIVPWKYGFKGIKSIVKIKFVKDMPETTWNMMAPHEYGFYANVNPKVDHPRWSQAKERRIGEFFKRDTLVFNGYADQVGHLYADMDLSKWY